MPSESVKVTISGYPFVCTALSNADFTDQAAVYVILCVSEGGSWTVLDVGQTGKLGMRIDSHDRRGCWTKNCPNNNIWVCIYKMPSNRHTKEHRLALEAKLRQLYSPPCGSR